ncbi:MAG: hypothetical protein NWF04_02085 [Candidatus Bathyarchaeota archaeon]|nr:hypothetical protein [Candidatus Bathyarchaeota archaeon]
MKTGMPKGLYMLLVWMVINIVFFVISIPGDPEDLNNYIEPLLWAGSAVGLFSMRKTGAAFATTVLGITMGTSMFNVIYFGFNGPAVGAINGLRIIINAIAIAYTYKLIYQNKFN